MKIIKRYLERQTGKHFEVHDIQPSPELDFIVVIPACGEADFIDNCLASLDRVDGVENMEIIVVINEGNSPSAEILDNNLRALDLVDNYSAKNNSELKILSLCVNSSNFKKPGVGLARKIGMDEAARRFLFLEKDGIIVCLDADCTIESNYYTAIKQGFASHPKMLAASIAFQHSTSINRNEIIQYETHLRYFIDIQRFYKFPFAFQTVGSAMAVRASAYCAYGGMNTKQAGEDFYFLQKFIANDVVFEINETKVRPSGRTSNRVPFGTGKAVGDLKENHENFKTYDPKNFELIHQFVSIVLQLDHKVKFEQNQFTELNHSMMSFLKSVNFIDKLNEIRSNTNSLESFIKRFFQWFNAFQLMKCLHFLRDVLHPNIPVGDAVSQYFKMLGFKENNIENQLKILQRRASAFN